MRHPRSISSPSRGSRRSSRRRKLSPTSPTDFWDSLAAFANPVPHDLPAAMRALGIDLLRELSKPDSTEYLARCPAHLSLTGKRDRRPSFSVNSSTGLFHCFSCGYAGPFIQLVEDGLGFNRIEAFQWIARLGVYRTVEDTGPTPAVDDAVRVTEASLALFTPPPQRACERRRVSPEACQHFGVLWNTETRHWILPIRDPLTGELWGWQEKGRKFFLNYPTGIRKSLTLFGDLTWSGDSALLLESPLDVVRAYTLGIPGAFSSFGAHVSEAQMRLLKSRCRNLILGLDNDSAGRTSRDKIHDRWRPRGLPMKYLEYSHTTAKDLGDMSDTDALSAYGNAHHPWRRRR
ncbi:toprim domain-containing protein [Actinacidiphila sp. ITFR-21]|uniref:toprim domain-containing protein n=1 Tax=Actinacidiphila sp. ITFR-21 TaxID=3075199 RepID=UPI00288B304C|nr:toprim domain-containing protein [Streptomyces sp. ITFR-21]WNI17598.1 CHC2 zinc finger domain-containing protein [Streptomyces sp. ITFR-21]WNI17738.1 CHC2 zinc finger domain-containing protein [Streptomyces sp. ITFR-21]